MILLMLSEFEVALNKANEVNALLRRSGEKFVELPKIIDAVKEKSGYNNISLYFEDFSTIKKGSLSKAGAMLSTKEVDGKKTAEIIVNSCYEPRIQRFSVVHELGHLITNVPNYQYETPNDGRFTISYHINADVTYITEEECKKDPYKMAEQIANIFALMVLIPDKITIPKMVDEGVETLASTYGVSEEALYSRMLFSV